MAVPTALSATDKVEGPAAVQWATMIEVVGVGAGGVDTLDPRTRDIVTSADVVVAGRRLLESLPADTDSAQVRRPLPSPLLANLDGLLRELAPYERVVFLASGDPLLSGIGTTLIRRLGAEAVRCHPAVSSVTLARASMGWSAEETEVVSLVSTPVAAVRRYLTPNAPVLVLSAGSRTPGELARLLIEDGLADATLTVLGDLGSDRESRRKGTADDVATWPETELPALNIVALAMPGTACGLGTSPGLPDAAYEHDGQISKYELRAAALAVLRPTPGQLLWDLGAGAGSVGIEWALHHPRCRTISVEHHPARVEAIGRNAATFGATNVQVIHAEVADAVDGLPTPDGVFIGGGATTDLIDRAWDALRPGGRIVVHTVTLETEQLVIDAYHRYGGELRRILVERAEPLGRYLSWKPARPVVQWSATKAPHAPRPEET